MLYAEGEENFVHNAADAYAPSACFDPLTTTAFELKALLESGAVTSLDLIETYSKQIEMYDDYLKAVIQVSTTATQQARERDEERRIGRVRGPLHGIPILLKDNIATAKNLGLKTTCGALALVSSKQKQNATIVDKLQEAGLIIFAKTQLTELSGWRQSNMMAGWSSVRGQCQSAYTSGNVDPRDTQLGHSTPGGSSTGSAVGTSAGYAPFAVGTDSIGSLISPATRAALYTLRPTMGLVSQRGIFPASSFVDTAGPMCKTPQDLALLLDVLANPCPGKNLTSYTSYLEGDWKSLRVGTLDPTAWRFGTEVQKEAEGALEQIIRETKSVYETIRSLCGAYHEIDLISPTTFIQDGKHLMMDVFKGRFVHEFEHELRGLDYAEVRSFEELIRWNDDNQIPGAPEGTSHQDVLLACQRNQLDAETAESLWSTAQSIGREFGIDKALHDHEIDVILAPSDSTFSQLVSAAGYPSATMPLSYLEYNGRPFGVSVFSTAYAEPILVRVLSAWEKTFGPRKPPSMQFEQQGMFNVERVA